MPYFYAVVNAFPEKNSSTNAKFVCCCKQVRDNLKIAELIAALT
ncbi:MAG: hypothetical protein ACI8YD_002293, partial [Rheinheimera aquimaris]